MANSTNNTKPNPLIELTINLIIPSLILMNLSDPEDLGPIRALLLALAFPLFWGARDLIGKGKVNVIATLGLVSVLLTGGIGILHLDAQWLAVKEAAIPGLIGVAVAISAHTRYPLVRVLLFTPALMNVEKIQTTLAERGTTEAFETRLKIATWMLSASFFFSSVMNYILAVWLVTSPAGTPAFNEELGRMNLLSYPVIALPATVLMMAVLYYLSRAIRDLAGLSLTDVLNH
ncbi:MAG: VC0807 family protein [Rhodocyclaceae bacterium]|nr:VC0807 family protein [Rhodocyclaceae bacterium]